MNGFELTLETGSRRVAVRIGRPGELGGGDLQAERGACVWDAGFVERHAPGARELASRLLRSEAEPLVLPGSEESKRAESVPDLWREMARRGLDRNSLLVVGGGGAVLDAGVFLAATWHRGIPCVLIPTTLLAQVDAGLGGKCGFNLGSAKNQAGVIYQPRAVLVCPEFLVSNPLPAWRSGLGELLKSALLSGGDLWERVAALDRPRPPDADGESFIALVEGCLRFKAGVVEEDERERGRRILLNLGHTTAHVLEGLAMAGGVPATHGEAVAAGILAEARAFRCPGPAIRAAEDGLAALGLREALAVPWSETLAADLILRDKKAGEGALEIPVLTAPGRAEIRRVGVAAAFEAVRAAIA